MSNVFDKLIEKAKHTGKRIVLTETEDERGSGSKGRTAKSADPDPGFRAGMVRPLPDAA